MEHKILRNSVTFFCFWLAYQDICSQAKKGRTAASSKMSQVTGSEGACGKNETIGGYIGSMSDLRNT